MNIVKTGRFAQTQLKETQYRQTDGRTDGRTEGQTDRQADRQTDKQTDR